MSRYGGVLLVLLLATACGDSDTIRTGGGGCSADGWCVMSPTNIVLAGANYTDVWGSPNGEIWAVGDLGVAHIYANDQWGCAPVTGACAGSAPPEAVYSAVDADWPTVFLAQWDRLLAYDGVSTTQVGTDLGTRVNALSVAPGEDPYVVAGDRVVEWRVNDWVTSYFDQQGRAQRAMWSTTNMCVVGDAGSLAYQNLGWVTAPSGTSADLLAIWGTTGVMWIVGEAGTTIRFTPVGPVFDIIDAGVSSTLRAVWGKTTDQIWAVGDDGTVLRWDGSSWNREQSGTTHNLTGLWSDDQGSVLWAVGQGGVVLKKTL